MLHDIALYKFNIHIHIQFTIKQKSNAHCFKGVFQPDLGRSVVAGENQVH